MMFSTEEFWKPMVAPPVGFNRSRNTVSFVSCTESGKTGTVKVFTVSPSANDNVPTLAP